MREALNGVRVLDFTTNAAGPTCSAMLADYGARVIKIERPGRGDDNRTYPPIIDKQGLVHCWLNRGKESITLDLTSKEGQDIAKELALSCDIICESYRPGIMDRFGLGYEELSAQKPGLVYCSVSAYGITGPYAKKAGYDLIAQAMSGLIDMIGEKDGTPLKSGLVIGDYWGGLNAFCGVLTAWYYYLKTGEGQQIDASLVQNLVYLNSAVLGVNVGDPITRSGNRNPDHTPYDIFKGYGQQYAAITVTTEEQWWHLCQIAKFSDWFDKNEKWRNQHWQEITDGITSWLEGFSKIEEPITAMVDAGIPCMKVGDMEAVMNDEHIAKSDWVVPVPMPDGVTSLPTYQGRNVHVEFSRTPGKMKKAPLLGQNNHDVLGALGMTTEQIDKLQTAWLSK